MDAFTVVAEPTRRRILDQLRESDRSVGQLVDTLAVSQPTVSKHLRVLRTAGFVTSRTEAQRRVYSLEAAPLLTVAHWLDPYREHWTTHLDALARHLDRQE
jgi:DNA-binding transcriptional ArsR family regulator